MKSQIITSYGPTLADAKLYLRVDHDLEDMLISALVTASYAQVCAECNRDFAPTTSSVFIVAGSTEHITVQDVDWVSTGSLQVRPEGSYVTFDTYYSGKLTYGTGGTQIYSGSIIPQNVIIAQLVFVSHFYDQRGYNLPGRTTDIKPLVDSLLSPFKLVTPGCTDIQPEIYVGYNGERF